MTRLFKGWLGLTLGVLLVRVGILPWPAGDGPGWALAGPLGLLCAGLAWQLWGTWNLICHLCGWKENKE